MVLVLGFFYTIFEMEDFRGFLYCFGFCHLTFGGIEYLSPSSLPLSVLSFPILRHKASLLNAETLNE